MPARQSTWPVAMATLRRYNRWRERTIRKTHAITSIHPSRMNRLVLLAEIWAGKKLSVADSSTALMLTSVGMDPIAQRPRAAVASAPRGPRSLGCCRALSPF